MGCCASVGIHAGPTEDQKQHKDVKIALGAPPSPSSQGNSKPHVEEEDWSWKRVILGSYRVVGADVLGIGNFSVLRRGVHTSSGAIVAVKSLKSGDEGKFKREVLLFKYLFGEEARPGTPMQPSASQFKASTSFFQSSGSEIEIPEPSAVLVKMLEHTPLDALGEAMYMVLELGQFSLNDFIVKRYDRSRAGLQNNGMEHEIRRVMVHVASGLYFLHSMLFVHGDLKPANVMWFGDQKSGSWKLIDLDGLLHASDTMDMQEADFYTGIYAAPEIAKAATAKESLRASRLLDVWALGVTLLEMELLVPPLRAKYVECCAEDDDNGDARFLQWLGNAPTPLVVPESPCALSKEMKDVLQDKILVDHILRVSVPVLLQLPICEQASRYLEDASLPSLEAVEKQEAPKPKPKTAWQLYQETHAQELKDQGLKGVAVTKELHKRWKVLLAEGGPEVDSLFTREAELRDKAARAEVPPGSTDCI